MFVRLLIAASFFVSLAHAQLTFEQSDLTKKVEPGTKEVIIEYPFENKSEKDVTIVSYDAPCGCLKAEIHPVEFGKGPIPPGGKGFVRTTFSVGNFSGTVNKSIGLFYSENPKPDQMLNLEVEIPVIFSISPKTLKWTIGEEMEAKTFKVKVNHDKPIKVTKLSSTNSGFSLELKTLTEGWEYEVTVTPAKEVPGFGIVRFDTDCTIPGYKRHQAFVVIRRPN